MDRREDYVIGFSVLSKAPIAGLSKSRLAQGLGAQKAADFTRYALEAILDDFHSIPVLRADLSPASPEDAQWFGQNLLADALTDIQYQGHLGERMLHAIKTLFDRYPDVMFAGVVGSDAPDAPRAALVAELMDEHRFGKNDQGVDGWVCPTVDGGFWALALHRRVFQKVESMYNILDSVEWSSGQEYKQTYASFSKAGLKVKELLVHWDVDKADDFMQLIARLETKSTERTLFQWENRLLKRLQALV